MKHAAPMIRIFSEKNPINNLCRNMDCSVFNLEGSNVVFNNILEIVSMSNFSLNQEAVDVKWIFSSKPNFMSTRMYGKVAGRFEKRSSPIFSISSWYVSFVNFNSSIWNRNFMRFNISSYLRSLPLKMFSQKNINLAFLCVIFTWETAATWLCRLRIRMMINYPDTNGIYIWLGSK